MKIYDLGVGFQCLETVGAPFGDMNHPLLIAGKFDADPLQECWRIFAQVYDNIINATAYADNAFTFAGRRTLIVKAAKCSGMCVDGSIDLDDVHPQVVFGILLTTENPRKAASIILVAFGFNNKDGRYFGFDKSHTNGLVDLKRVIPRN